MSNEQLKKSATANPERCPVHNLASCMACEVAAKAGTSVAEKPLTLMRPELAALLAQPSAPSNTDDPILSAMKRLFLRVQLCACHGVGADQSPLTGLSCQTCQLDLASLQEANDWRG